MDVHYTCYSVVKVSVDDIVTLYIHGLSLHAMGYSDKGVPVSPDAHNIVSCSDGMLGGTVSHCYPCNRPLFSVAIHE